MTVTHYRYNLMNCTYEAHGVPRSERPLCLGRRWRPSCLPWHLECFWVSLGLLQQSRQSTYCREIIKRLERVSCNKVDNQNIVVKSSKDWNEFHTGKEHITYLTRIYDITSTIGQHDVHHFRAIIFWIQATRIRHDVGLITGNDVEARDDMRDLVWSLRRWRAVMAVLQDPEYFASHREGTEVAKCSGPLLTSCPSCTTTWPLPNMT